MGEEFVSDDEFHETFEDIPAASGSEIFDDEEETSSDNSINNMRITKVAPAVEDSPVWTSSTFQSKFSVWKDDPSSINERRQRFFKQMGLRSSRDEPLDGSALSGNGFVETGSIPSRNLSDVESGSTSELVNLVCEKCGGKVKGCTHIDGENTVTDGERASKLLENSCKPNLGNGSLQVVKPDQEILPVLVTGNGESDLGLKSSKFLGQKTCDCAESVGTECTHENSMNGAENQGLVVKRLDSISSSSLGDGSRHHHRASSSQDNLFEFYDTDYGSETSNSPQNAIDNIMEERLKIRDLDSGKEFLMKRFNRDGSLNMLRDVATGKDLTLAEFEKTLGLFSPVAQELHRRRFGEKPEVKPDGKPPMFTKRKSWLKKLKGALKTSSKDGRNASARSGATFETSSQRSMDDTDTSSQLGSLSGDGSPKRTSSFAGLDRSEFTRRGSLPAEDADGNFWRKPQKVKVKLRQKSSRELSDLHLSQEIIAHQGAIWTMKFSPDGRYLASAGQDRVVHVWEVVDHPSMAGSDLWKSSEKGDRDVGRKEDSIIKVCVDGSVKAGQDRSMVKIAKEGSIKSGRGTQSRRQKSSNHSKGPVPKLFWLSEKPMCTFRGHTDDILDLSWSRSQFLLSSSMDKTVRLWHISYDECLRVFSHNDYVTCAQFNPLDDRYFLSGSLDDRVRIWSIPDHHVVDWNDLQEMVTAVCYTPDGKKVIVGSYKGTCRFYNATGNKLQLESYIDVREENKKARGKKITGLHCMPGDPQKVLVTSNDSRVRVYDGLNLVAKYKGLRNVKSQISSSFSPAGDFIISASEDSRVLVWNSGNRDVSNKTSIYRRDKQLSCEEFTARHVSVAIAWPGSSTPPLQLGSGRYEPPLEKAAAAAEDVQAPNDPESSPSQDEPVLTTKSSDEELKCPSYCLGRSPLGIFGSGRKHSVAVADELTSTKQQQQQQQQQHVEGGANKPHSHHHQLDASASPAIAATCKVPLQSDTSDQSLPHRRSSFFPECGPRASATWPEEKLGALPGLTQSASVCSNVSAHNEETPPIDVVSAVSPAWGLVFVTAGLGGEITTFQNYGFPVRL